MHSERLPFHWWCSNFHPWRKTLHNVMESFSEAYKFGLTISIKKTNVMGQQIVRRTLDRPWIYVPWLCHLWYVFTVKKAQPTNREGFKHSLKIIQEHVEQQKTNGEAMIHVYIASVLSTLLYASEMWTLMALQENRIRAFYMSCLRQILGLTWEDKVTNHDVLTRASIQWQPSSNETVFGGLATCTEWKKQEFQSNWCMQN